MTTKKLAISLPHQLVAQAQVSVKRGRSTSVSAYIARALEAQHREESLHDLVQEMIAEHGEPTEKDKAWARNVVSARP